MNVELKARCQDLGRLRETCISLGAEGQEPDRQLDTYFKVPHGQIGRASCRERECQYV